jgi:transcriptional regulator with XRE-family HTH domain
MRDNKRSGNSHVESMTDQGATFGQTISKARKEKSLSQKDLAGIILKEEDSTAISPQYLNDIEHDRRSPTSDHLIRQFAKALDLKEDLLFVLAGKIPDDVRRRIRNTDQAAEAFMSFRTSITKK